MSRLVEVHNISKKYVIHHEQKSAYNTLVETLSNQAKRGLKKLLHPFRKSPSSSTQEDFWALQDINLTIEEGDRIGIIGRNGAGKSTLLKILSRITEHTSGTIKMRGRVACLLEVGTGFHPELTGRENIFLNGAILGMTRQEIKRKFDEIVAFSEVEQFLDTPVKRFSSGMHTRLGFAIAAHLEPDLLIVDEVLAVGDAQFQEKCLKKLNDLSRHGRTILFVSHDIGAIFNICNKGVFLEKGRVQESGPIDRCVHAYTNHCRLQGLSWEGNVGDEHIRFYRARLLNKEQRDFFYQGEEAILEIEYEVLKSASDLVIGIAIWNQRNQRLARSHTFHDANAIHRLVQPGRHRAHFSVDSRLFLQGDYRLALDCFIYNKKQILQDEVSLKFPIYARKDTQLPHYVEPEGIFLGNRWQLQ